MHDNQRVLLLSNKMKVTIEMLQMSIVTLLSPLYCHHIATDYQTRNT